jgi:hypothetical protein
LRFHGTNDVRVTNARFFGEKVAPDFFRVEEVLTYQAG